MADKGKGKAVDDTAGTSSPTSGPSFLAAPGGGGGTGLSQSQLRIPTTTTTTTTLQQPLSNQASGSAPLGGQNQIANPQFAGGGGGGGSGAGYGGFSQFAHGHGGFFQLHSSPPAAATLGSEGLGNGGFSQPAATLGYGGSYQSTAMGNPAFHAGGPYTPACTICKAPTPLLWNATTVQVQGTRMGTPLPICCDCYMKIFAGGRPLDHLEQYLASTAVGRGFGSIPEFLAAIGRGGWFSASQWAVNPVTSPWCVSCNFPAELLWGNLPMCQPCYGQCLDKMTSYECAKAPIQGEQDVDQALARIRAEKALAQQQVDAALAQGRRIVIGPQRQLDHGQSSSAAPPHAQAPRCHRCGAPEPTRMSQGGFPVCELCFNT